MAGQKAVSRYKICIVTEAAGLARRWAGRAGRAGGARTLVVQGAELKRTACAHLGVLLGQQAVHLVHPACFLTQYCF